MKIIKNNIKNNIEDIRKEIGHEDSEINIKKIIYDEKNDELWIITPDRPEKSAIIGKGGWVVGKLREKLKINKIHVESYSDYLIKEYRMDLSLNKVNSFIEEQKKNNISRTMIKTLNNLKYTLEERLKNIYSFNFNEFFDENKYEEDNQKNQAIVALSGGVDSSFSLVIAKKLGFNPIAVTVDPGTIILPNQFKHNIKKLCEKISVKHEYINIDYNEIIKNSLEGKFHPCGRCSKETQAALFKYGEDKNINLVIFGDMLSTGSQCITKYNNSEKKDQYMFRLNLPATLSIGKEEIKQIMSEYNLEKIKGFGCPLLHESHKKYPYFKKFSIQRILRETRSSALEPGEALDLIWSFYNTK
ncbi:hypothetical protein SDC9_29467 [bioreactor metagenome]|uniref:tRNA-specific 2-thiouridylase MnmA n=1 Tax=bioreactor metagenome TaxID=1076179 RepID=A0A644UXL3_9ZZZZ|nr:7-cyano-7-deazaguanine synthase [Methanobrevibacter sp.]MEA4957858.1 7-cyano-7-deazaguanine synthase [Methanobrevibacter sp.]